MSNTELLHRFMQQWNDSLDVVEAHTSGSTGSPKRIFLSKNDMRRSAEATNEFFGIDSQSELICPLSIDYIAGKMMVVRAEVAQCKLTVLEPSIIPLPDNFRCKAIDLLPIVPAQISGLLENPAHMKVRNLIVGGAAPSPEQESMLLDSGVNAWITYGMTETCSHVALRRVGLDKTFEALPGYKFSVDARGCLTIENHRMSFKRLITNDIVELLDNRHFSILGRYDNVIISGGKKFFPESMELKLRGQFTEREFYITSQRSEKWGCETVLMVEGVADEALTEKLLATCRNLFERHAVPKRITYQDAFERTGSGKIRRKRF